MRKAFVLALASVGIAMALGTPRGLRADDPPPTPATVGSQAPTFTLETIEGSEISTADLKGYKKTVVLQWIDPDCPYVEKHLGKNTYQRDLARAWKNKDVVWLLVASGKSADRTRLQGRAGEWKLEVPILLDPTSRAANLFGATTTLHTYVIDEEGTLVYAGAVDDKAEGWELGKVNYVERALQALSAGDEAYTPTTFPYGSKLVPADLN